MDACEKEGGGGEGGGGASSMRHNTDFIAININYKQWSEHIYIK